MTTTTYSILQLALSKQIKDDKQNLDFVRKNPYSDSAIAFWEKQVGETKQAIVETREIYEASMFQKLVR